MDGFANTRFLSIDKHGWRRRYAHNLCFYAMTTMEMQLWLMMAVIFGAEIVKAVGWKTSHCSKPRTRITKSALIASLWTDMLQSIKDKDILDLFPNNWTHMQIYHLLIMFMAFLWIIYDGDFIGHPHATRQHLRTIIILFIFIFASSSSASLMLPRAESCKNNECHIYRGSYWFPHTEINHLNRCDETHGDRLLLTAFSAAKCTLIEEIKHVPSDSSRCLR